MQPRNMDFYSVTYYLGVSNEGQYWSPCYINRVYENGRFGTVPESHSYSVPTFPFRPSAPNAAFRPSAPNAAFRPSAPNAAFRPSAPNAAFRPSAPNAAFRPSAPNAAQSAQRSGTRNRGKFCGFCRSNGEQSIFFRSHSLKKRGKLTCPILRAYTCPQCQATGDDAHTISYCPITMQPPAIATPASVDTLSTTTDNEEQRD